MTSITISGRSTTRFALGQVQLPRLTIGQLVPQLVTPPVTTPYPVIALGLVPISHPEGNSGATNYVYTTTRTGDLSVTSSVAWAVTGSGTNPADATDFMAGSIPSGTITFAAGVASVDFIVQVNGDSAVEPDEGFTVTLSNPVRATLGLAVQGGTIANDDSAAPSVVSNAVVGLGDSIGAGFFTALKNARPDLVVTNLAIPGATLNGSTYGAPNSTDLAGSQQLGALLAMPTKPAVVVIECGANDLMTWYLNHGNSASGYMAARKSVLIDPIKAWSPNTKIIIATVLARADHGPGVFTPYNASTNPTGYDPSALAGMNTARAQDRTAIFAAKAAGQIDYIVDYQTDVMLGDDMAPTTGVQNDGVHPTAAMSDRLVDLYSGAVDVVLTSQPDTKPLDFSFVSQSNVAANSDIFSAPVTIEHLGPGVTTTIAGRYTKNSTNPTDIKTTPGTAVHGDVIRAVAHTGSAGANTSQDVTIGGVTRTFAVATAGVPIQVTPSTEGPIWHDYGTEYPATIDVVQTLPAGYLLFGIADSTGGGQKPASIQVFAPSDTGKTKPIVANLLDGGIRTGPQNEGMAIYGCQSTESGAHTFRVTAAIGVWHNTAVVAVSAQHATGVDPTVVGWEGNYAGGGQERLAPASVTPAPNGAWVSIVAGDGAFFTSGADCTPAAGSIAVLSGTQGILAGWGYGAGKPAWGSSTAYWGGVGAILCLHP